MTKSIWRRKETEKNLLK